MIFDILEQKIIDAGLGEPGVSLFRNFMPADCKIGVLIRAPLQGIPIDPYIRGWYKSPMQVIVRHSDPVDGNKLANEVMRVLTVEGTEYYPPSSERGRAKIELFYPTALPVQFPRLEGNGIEWSLNFTTAFAFEFAAPGDTP